MAVFKSTKLDKVVSVPSGFITFKNGLAEVSDKKDIEAMGKAKDVEPATSEDKKAFELANKEANK